VGLIVSLHAVEESLLLPKSGIKPRPSSQQSVVIPTELSRGSEEYGFYCIAVPVRQH
jgi:hypothetical protein